MEVVEHQPGAWYLLHDGAHHYLDVNVHQPMVDTSILVRFDDEEEAELILGRVFVDYLAAKVNYWPDRFRSRDVGATLGGEAQEAIRRWLG